MVEIDFQKIRPIDSSRRDGFEELCCQLLSLTPPETTAVWTRKRGAGGDGGVEGYWTLKNGDQQALQAKFFEKLEDPQRRQLTKSVKAMLANHPRCTHYIICIPFDLTDRSQGKKWSQRRHWDELVTKWAALTPDREVLYELWDKSKLTGLLSIDRPELNGRRRYWFDQTVFQGDWFSDRFAEARKNLGPRYTPKLNVELPLAKRLDAVRRGTRFWQNLADVPELPGLYTTVEAARELSKPIVDRLSQANLLIEKAVLRRNVGHEIARAKTLISEARTLTEQNIDELGSCDPAQRAAFSFLDRVRLFDEHLRDCHVLDASRSAVMLIGDAGVGKSHILADLTQQALVAKQPAVLLLGQQFRSGQPWPFVLNALDFDGNAEEFLGALDACAQVAGCKAMLAIDALNEGAGKQIWPEELAGFVERVRRFPNVALIASCRSSYQRRITTNVSEDDLHIIIHSGFQGHEETAAAVFFDRNGISRPDSPFLDPEFSNPLFLKTICETLKRNNETTFPKGLRGVTRIFDYYYSSVEAAINARLGLDANQRLVRRAIDALMSAMAEESIDFISRQRAYDLVEAIMRSNGDAERNLLAQLTSEGVLVDDIVYDSVDDTYGVDGLRFSYERLLDHFRASAFIDKHMLERDPREAFVDGGPFLQELNGRPYLAVGFLDALAIQVPERFDVELYNLVERGGADRFWLSLFNVLGESFARSLHWRDAAKTNAETVQTLNTVFGDLGRDSFEVLLRCAAVPNHMLNARWLHQSLMNITLADRDAVWSVWLAEQPLEPVDEHGSAVWSLIDWCWSVERRALDRERVYLSCLALGWLFSTPLRTVRDRATKAMAALVSSDVGIMRRLLLDFDRVDDLYILERLYAVAYSLALSVNPKDLRGLARTVLNRVFRRKSPRYHAQLQDYAFGIVRVAGLTHALPEPFAFGDRSPEIDDSHPLQNFLPSDIEKLYEKVRAVHGSTMGGDFGTYTMRNVLDFSPTLRCAGPPQSWAEVTQQFVDDVSNRNPLTGPLFEEYFRAVTEELQQSDKRFNPGWESLPIVLVAPDGAETPKDPSQVSSDYDKAAHDRAKQSIGELSDALDQILNEAEKEIWRWLNRGRSLSGRANFSRRWVKRWIINRVVELGWTEEQFADFERYSVQYGGRMDHASERMGKKYQWIALNEAIAILAAHYHYLGSFGDNAQDLKGTWQLGRRDLDPTLLLKGQTRRLTPTETWWTLDLPDLTEDVDWQQACDWVRTHDDLPQDFRGLVRSNPGTGQAFYVLETYNNARHRRISLQNNSRSLSQSITSVVVPKSEVKRVTKALRGEKISGAFYNPREHSGDAFLGEYPWHDSWYPIADFFGERDFNRLLPNDLQVHFPTRRYSCENSSYDQSLVHTVRMLLPSGHLIDQLDMKPDRYAPSQWTSREEHVFCDPALETDHDPSGLIDLEVLGDWLRKNDFAVLSANVFFKQYYQSRPSDDFAGELMDCQLTFFDGAAVSGERWVVLTEMGPNDQVVVKPQALPVQGLRGLSK